MMYQGFNVTDNNLTILGISEGVNASVGPNVTDACQNIYGDFKTLILHVKFYLLAIVIPPGLILNILTFICFVTSTSLRRTTTGHYLVALTVADFTFLVGKADSLLN